MPRGSFDAHGPRLERCQGRGGSDRRGSIAGERRTAGRFQVPCDGSAPFRAPSDPRGAGVPHFCALSPHICAPCDRSGPPWLAAPCAPPIGADAVAASGPARLVRRAWPAPRTLPRGPRARSARLDRWRRRPNELPHFCALLPHICAPCCYMLPAGLCWAVWPPGAPNAGCRAVDSERPCRRGNIRGRSPTTDPTRGTDQERTFFPTVLDPHGPPAAAAAGAAPQARSAPQGLSQWLASLAGTVRAAAGRCVPPCAPPIGADAVATSGPARLVRRA